MNKYVLATLIICSTVLFSIWAVLPHFYMISRAQGYSMNPTLDPQSLVVCRKTNQAEVGAIYIYTDHEGDGVIHRLIKVDGNKYYFKGDNNFYVDVPVTKKRIKSKLVWWTELWKFEGALAFIVGSCIGASLILFRKEVKT